MSDLQKQVKVADVVFDESIYPRSEWSQTTVDRYAEALTCGEEFPPIVLESGTNRLWDGVHRWRAHERAGRDEIAAVWQECTEGVPPKLFAASFSVKHGDQISGADLKGLAREICDQNPDYDIRDIAARLGKHRETVAGWVGDIKDKRLLLRRAKVLLLSRGGWTQREIGDALGVDHKTVGSDVGVDISPHLTESFLRGVASQLPPNDLDIDYLIDLILYAEEEAEARADVLENYPDFVADVEDPKIKHPANYREALALALQQDKAEQKKRAQDKKDREEANRRDANRIRAFVSGFDCAYSMATGAHPVRDEVLYALDEHDRKRFLRIESAVTWPQSRP